MLSLIRIKDITSMWRHWSCSCCCQIKPAGDLVPAGTMLVTPDLNACKKIQQGTLHSKPQ